MSAKSPLDRPLPSGKGDSARYWAALRAGRIELPRCQACESLVFYPRPHCPVCHGHDLEWVTLSGRGRVYTCTVVHRATHPWFMDKTPYVYALVELEEGVRLPSQIVGVPPAEVTIGLEVEAVFEKVDDEHTLLLFRPAGLLEA